MGMDFNLAWGTNLNQAQADLLYRKLPVIQYNVPISGDTIAISQRNTALILEPAAGLAALTINMPSSPQNNDMVSIVSTQAVVAVTHGNGTMVGALSALVALAPVTYIYYSSTNKWYKIG